MQKELECGSEGDKGAWEKEKNKTMIMEAKGTGMHIKTKADKAGVS